MARFRKLLHRRVTMMSETIHLRDDLKVRTFPIPDSDFDPFKADELSMLRHGFIPRPTGHRKLSAMWERAARRTTRVVKSGFQILEHRKHPEGLPSTSSWSGADFNTGTNLNWVTATFTVPAVYNQPPDEPTSVGPNILMGVSLGRMTANNFIIAGVYSYAPNPNAQPPSLPPSASTSPAIIRS